MTFNGRPARSTLRSELGPWVATPRPPSRIGSTAPAPRRAEPSSSIEATNARGEIPTVVPAGAPPTNSTSSGDAAASAPGAALPSTTATSAGAAARRRGDDLGRNSRAQDHQPARLRDRVQLVGLRRELGDAAGRLARCR